MNISTNPIPSRIKAPTSKSYANRALILAALEPKPITIQGIPDSQDVLDLKINLEATGLIFESDQWQWTVTNQFPECEPQGEELIDLPGSEGGTTIRFLMSLLSLGKRKYRLKLKERMSKRPLQNQIEALVSMGAKIELREDVLEIQGPIKTSGEISIDCSDTTQGASSLLLLSRKYDLTIKPLDMSFSSRYWEMTESICKNFDSPYQVPADFSSLSYLVAYAVLNQDLEIEGVSHKDHLQADARLMDYLSELGARFEIENNVLKVFKSNLKGSIEIDVKECLDLFPTLAFLAAFSSAQFSFKNLAPLQFKESDRRAEVFKLFDYFNVEYKYFESEDRLSVYPSQPIKSEGPITLPNDHRIIMAYALMLKQLGGGKVPQYQSVSKSFGNFFEYFS